MNGGQDSGFLPAVFFGVLGQQLLQLFLEFADILEIAIDAGEADVGNCVVGWFTQIAFNAALIQLFFAASPESALACGAMLLVDTFMSVIPLGIIWLRVEGVSLRKVTAESEHAGEEANHSKVSTQEA